MSHPFTGTYCISNLGFTPRVVIVTPATSDTLTTAAPGGAPSCPDAAAVASFSDSGLTAKDTFFSVLIR